MDFSISSPAFVYGALIPQEYSCDSTDLSPELKISSPPAGTLSFALINDDPDAPGGCWTHWVVYDLPKATETIPKGGPLPEGAKEGQNDFGNIGYGGPCPPRGHGPHRYFFKLYALDVETIGLGPNASKSSVEDAIKPHILGEAQIMGTFERK
jgi:Raf kinase inhibitor-like YbhB/YbcL family protein